MYQIEPDLNLILSSRDGILGAQKFIFSKFLYNHWNQFTIKTIKDDITKIYKWINNHNNINKTEIKLITKDDVKVVNLKEVPKKYCISADYLF